MLTTDELALLADDLVAEAAMLLEALRRVVPVQLQGCTLCLQLAHAAQQPQCLALLFCTHGPWQRLLQPPASLLQLP